MNDGYRSPCGDLRREGREIIWFVELLGLIKPIHQKIFEKAQPFLRIRKNLIHTRIALRYALRLLQSEKGDKKAIEAKGTVSLQKKEMTSCPKLPFRIYYAGNPVEVT